MSFFIGGSCLGCRADDLPVPQVTPIFPITSRVSFVIVERRRRTKRRLESTPIGISEAAHGQF
jgi:hypothetical protein